MNKSRLAFGIIAVIIVFVVMAALAAWYLVGPGDKKVFFDGMFGSLVGGLITAIVTLGLIWVGLSQLAGLNDTTSGQARTTAADFILRRTDRFFQPETRRLLHLIEDGYLMFEEKKPLRDSYFLVDEATLRTAGLHEAIKQTLLEKIVYSTYEIDDLILGPLEDLGSLEADPAKLVSFDLIYDFFSWYICRVWQNEHIHRYVEKARVERPAAADLYARLEALAKRCADQEPKETRSANG